MNSYTENNNGQRRIWNSILLLIALIIIAFSLFYTYNLYRQLKKQEKSKVEDIATAYNILLTGTDQLLLDQALEIIKKNNFIPIIWADKNGNILGTKNIDSSKITPQYLSNNIKIASKKKQVVEIPNENLQQYLYYRDSDILQNLKFFPIIQIMLVSLFLFIAYRTFQTGRQAEQNQLWVGMAKETAHQLGTPISSLNAWIEVLKDKLSYEDQYIAAELDKDFLRLEIVAERFSKIGSVPTFHEGDIIIVLQEMMDYFSKRAAKNIAFHLDYTTSPIYVSINRPLIEWVFENLFKNALDAMEGKGSLQIQVIENPDNIIINITDDGKGIAKNKWKQIFEPGYSTKKRGWGLGLTLVKRIIVQYHRGHIYVVQSTPYKATTFRIILKK
jgi:signal transduction histidine kinase